MKKIIKDAIIEVLKLSRTPLTSREIFETIVKSNLYTFNAKSPESLVSGQLRQHCEGVVLKTSKPNKFFKIKDGKYTLL
jgi:restriction system protein